MNESSVIFPAQCVDPYLETVVGLLSGRLWRFMCFHYKPLQMLSFDANIYAWAQ